MFKSGTLNDASSRSPILFAVATAAAAVSAIVAGALCLLSWNPFTFHVVRVFPVGAAICGVIASSILARGYRRAHLLPGRRCLAGLAVGGVLISAAGWLLQYALWTRNADSVGFASGFGVFLDHVLMQGRGSWAYALPVLDPLAFLGAGIWLLKRLRKDTACEHCGRAKVRIGRATQKFLGSRDFSAWHRELLLSAPMQEEYVTLLTAFCQVDTREVGTHRYEFYLYRCAGCRREQVREVAAISDGRHWRPITELSRELSVPPRISLEPEFRRARRTRDEAA